MLERDQVYEAQALKEATLRRNLWRDKELVERIHRQLTDGLSKEIVGAAASYDNLLHPEQKIRLRADKMSVSLIDGGSPLVTCHFDTTSAGYVSLRLECHGGEQTAEQLRLEPIDHGRFVWSSAAGPRILAADLATYILRKLIGTAIEEVNREISTQNATLSQNGRAAR